jgi:3-isopropylmalate/(R)-2-methylmalate dehydratase small subunit
MRQIEDLIVAVNANPGYRLSVRLGEQYVEMPGGNRLAFDVPLPDKQRLMAGLDTIGNTLQQRDKISAFEQRQKTRFPWLYSD